MKKSVFLRQVIVLALICFAFSGSIIAEEPLTTNYVLIFQGTEYDSKLSDAVEYFFKDMLKPEDNMLYLTPQKPYQYSQQTRQSQSVDKLIQTTKDVLKQDYTQAGVFYKNILGQMEILVNAISTGDTGLRDGLTQYNKIVENLRGLRKCNEGLMLKIAQMFKQNKGVNNIIIFYQAELRIVPTKKNLDRFKGSVNYSFDVTETFEAEGAQDMMNVEAVSQALKETGAKLHIVYLPVKIKRRQNVDYKEYSGDVYNTFSKIAKETGGKVFSSANPLSALKEIAEVLK